jgi:hypothetical protein
MKQAMQDDDIPHANPNPKKSARSKRGFDEG